MKKMCIRDSSKGGNSGIFYLAQEVTSKDKDGNDVLEPIYISAPEYHVRKKVFSS